MRVTTNLPGTVMAADQEVCGFRSAYLPGLLQPEEIVEWVQQQAKSVSQMTGRKTTGIQQQDGLQAAGIEKHVLLYVGVKHVGYEIVSEHSVLDSLWSLGIRVASEYVVQEAQAVSWILTDRIPQPVRAYRIAPDLAKSAIRHRAGDSWNSLLDHWNQKPRYNTFDDVRNFQRAARRALGSLESQSLYRW